MGFKRIAGNLCTVLILTIGASLPSAAETYYRWTDHKGNPVLSDRPPAEGIEYDVVSTQSSRIRPVPADTGAVPKTVEPSVSNPFEAVEAVPSKVEKNAEYCSRATENLRLLNTAPRIRQRNDQGEMYFLDDEQRNAQKAEAQKAIDLYC